MNIKVYLIVIFLLITTSNLIHAQNDDCLDCHSDKELVKETKSGNISLFIDGNKFKNSVHGDLDCVDCHEDFDADEMPHKPGKNIAKVDCGNCHDDIAANINNDIHHRLKQKVGNKGPKCETCHGSHYIKSPKKIRHKEKYYCSQCHNNVTIVHSYHAIKKVSDKTCTECHETDTIRPELQKSVHKNLGCSDCHVYEAKNMEKHQDNIPHTRIADCYSCHKKESDQHKESIHGISLSEGIDEAAACWDCHGSHNVLHINDKKSPVYKTNIPKTCGKCHADKKIQKKFDFPVYDPVQSYSQSVHGKLLAQGAVNVPNCTTCHGVHDIKNVVQPNSKISPYNIPNTCKECHPQEVEDYEQSIHWVYVKKGVRFAPVCTDCHSEHGIKSINGKLNWKEARKTQEETCMFCHQSKKLAKKFGISAQGPKTYQDSYHGLAVMRGDEKAAMCIDCHTVHKILPEEDPKSSVNVANVKNTCRKCHAKATQIFSESYSHMNISVASNKAQKIVNTIYFWLILLVIGGMFIHNLIIYIHDIIEKRKRIKGNPTIPRMTTNEVIQHIFLLSSFIVLAITGFALKFSHSWWGEGLTNLGLNETLRQTIHRISAVIMIVTGLYHIVYLITTKRGKMVLGAMIPKFKDITQVSSNLSYYLGLSKTKPEFDKFDYTEKAEYWALIWGTIVMGATGFILWFPTMVGNWAPIWLIKVSQSIHFYEAILASLAIVVWHWFFVIFDPAQYPMNLTWIDGKMSLQEYLHHHKLDGYKLIFEWIKKKNGLIKENELSDNTKYVLNSLSTNKKDADMVLMEIINNDNELEKWLRDCFEKEKLNIKIKHDDS